MIIPLYWWNTLLKEIFDQRCRLISLRNKHPIPSGHRDPGLKVLLVFYLDRSLNHREIGLWDVIINLGMKQDLCINGRHRVDVTLEDLKNYRVKEGTFGLTDINSNGTVWGRSWTDQGPGSGDEPVVPPVVRKSKLVRQT